MQKTEIFIADPYNKNHIELYKEFEKENGLDEYASNYLTDISSKYNENDFHRLFKNKNENKTFLFLVSNNKISDTCLINYEKDRKTSTITFPTLEKQYRKIVDVSVAYSFKVLKSEEILSTVNENDKAIQKSLHNNGFESLGKEKDNIVFVKEKPIIKETEGTKIWR